jgi:predicted acylesterase/phospholipase RssA
MSSGVLAYSPNDGSHLFRSYETLSDEADVKVQEKPYVYQIWEVSRATTAAPTYFPPAMINGDEFIDGVPSI